ncbi:DUF1150 family protein [Arsenicitalea aurantiaca]|uniref:DUF1150 family protein n=1 Tax=Arsenicitalea aurantiaca TaxID=1783274 RepID=A0A433X8F9_9HYPH|nr:DUF1150 family protein [Arsenicitalea aurantiaca]RUT30342.1 DUF1150 family protein [Arsenicitalea aurantiaca]
MQQRSHTEPANPLRDLTPAQFMALGGNAVVYIRPIRGDALALMMNEPDFAEDEELQLVVSADGSPLLVADSTEAVEEWLADKNVGIAALH